MASPTYAIFKRELKSYFYSTTAFVYVTLFLFSANVFTFYIGKLLEQGQANLTPFFSFHPYLFLLFMPALAMRLWAEERKTGTIELLLTLPVSNQSLVIGKFLAAWAFSIIAIMGTFPLWATISFLGNPDHTIILFSYLDSFLLAGCFLAIGCFVSALTDNQIIAFILGTILCFLCLMTSFPLVTEPLTPFLSPVLLEMIIHFSALLHYDKWMKGNISLSSLIYFTSFISFWLILTIYRIHLLRMGKRG